MSVEVLSTRKVFLIFLTIPDNTELEALLTFIGDGSGKEVRSVTPTPELISVRQHHSFVRLPDDAYSPRKFHPESGYFFDSFYDYASPIGEDMQQRFIVRHRLEKINHNQKLSEAKEPIIYYIDSGLSLIHISEPTRPY